MYVFTRPVYCSSCRKDIAVVSVTADARPTEELGEWVQKEVQKIANRLLAEHRQNFPNHQGGV